MHVLVTGGAGYIGAVLVPHLLDSGYRVTVLDRFFFGREPLAAVAGDPELTLVRDDIRWFDPAHLDGVDAVLDLAALSNDPSGELDPAKTLDINYLGRVRVAKLAKTYGVARYVLASTCSVYGAQPGTLDESTPTRPLTTYARASRLAERDVLPLADEEFTVTTPRFATAYGLSPRMRFDLAINAMALRGHRTGEIGVMRDGTQWRPFVHIRDIARALALILEADPARVNGQVLNVGSNAQNYQLRPLAEEIADAVGRPCQLEWYGDPDTRSYRVAFDTIERTLEFTPEWTPRDGVAELVTALEAGTVTDSLQTSTVKWYRHLLAAHQLVRGTVLRDTLL